jgi:hypothetical protein
VRSIFKRVLECWSATFQHRRAKLAVFTLYTMHPNLALRWSGPPADQWIVEALHSFCTVPEGARMHACTTHTHGRLTNGYGGARGWRRAPRRVAPGGIPDARGRARARRGYARCLNRLGCGSAPPAWIVPASRSIERVAVQSFTSIVSPTDGVLISQSAHHVRRRGSSYA